MQNIGVQFTKLNPQGIEKMWVRISFFKGGSKGDWISPFSKGGLCYSSPFTHVSLMHMGFIPL
ncbi:MAG: hypothetical protein JETT_0133 [Candidatus Jettenia ecosi]|uniref:Uncharacterized protein n=1 Tax=Candidatus Jettenia ecosi TaxID=2494326 RepID=A0A533QFU2_9BACT|nr:MAG: hypothetical protein JETT_0133 [Candidatus Jettenia ecosi]